MRRSGRCEAKAEAVARARPYGKTVITIIALPVMLPEYAAAFHVAEVNPSKSALEGMVPISMTMNHFGLEDQICMTMSNLEILLLMKRALSYLIYLTRRRFSDQKLNGPPYIEIGTLGVLNGLQLAEATRLHVENWKYFLS